MIEVHQATRAVHDGLEDPLEIEARVDGVGDGVDQRQSLVGLAQLVGAFRDFALEVVGQLFELANLVTQLHPHAIDLVTERAELVRARDVYRLVVVPPADPAGGGDQAVDGAGDRAPEHRGECHRDHGQRCEPQLDPPIPRRHGQQQNGGGDDLQRVDQQLAANREHGGSLT